MPNIFCTWSIARAYCAPALVLYIFRKSAKKKKKKKEEKKRKK